MSIASSIVFSWVTLSPQSITANELDTIHLTCLARSINTIDRTLNQINYSIDYTKSILPLGVVSSVQQDSKLSPTSDMYGFLSITFPTISSTLFPAQVAVQATDQRSTISTTVAISLQKIPSAPVWNTLSPYYNVANSNLGTISVGSAVGPFFVRASDNFGLPITYSIQPTNGLPSGITFSSDDVAGSILGTVTSFNTDPNLVDEVDSDRIDFLIRAESTTGLYSERYFYFIRADLENETFSWSQDWLNGLSTTIDYSLTTSNSLISTSPIYVLGNVSQGQLISTILEVNNPNNTSLSYSLEPITSFHSSLGVNLLPAGISLSSTTGAVIGVPSLGSGTLMGSLSSGTNYYLRVNVTDPNNNNGSPTTDSIIFDITVTTYAVSIASASNLVYWVTPAGNIGVTYENYPSHFSVLATNPSGQAITYKLAPNSPALPTDMSLDINTGLIIGICPFVMATSVFTVIIRAQVNQTFADRTFTFTVLPLFSGFKEFLELSIPITGYNRQIIAISNWNTAVIPEKYIFRSSDLNWGRVMDPAIYLVKGLNYLSPVADNLSNYLRDYHRPFNLYTTSVNWAIVKDPNGNQICELIYLSVSDPNANAGGFETINTLITTITTVAGNIVSNTSTVKITVETPIYDTNIQTITSNIPSLLNQNESLEYWNYDNNSTTIANTLRIFPTSVSNIRNDLILTSYRDATDYPEMMASGGIGLAGKEGMPLWMTSTQIANNVSSTLGYTLAIPLIYVQSGAGKVVTTNIQQIGSASIFSGLVISVDKYLVKYTQGISETSFDGPDFSLGYTTFDVNINNLGYFSTTFDSTEQQAVVQFIKFPPGDKI